MISRASWNNLQDLLNLLGMVFRCGLVSATVVGQEKKVVPIDPRRCDDGLQEFLLRFGSLRTITYLTPWSKMIQSPCCRCFQ